MADRLQGLAGQTSSGPAAPLGLNPDVAGRGPTYERVQRLLEERRARAQAQASARAQLGNNEGASAPVRQGRAVRPFPSPDSDESFAFDRQPYTSDGGGLDGRGLDAIEEQESAALAPRHSQVSSVYAQVPWQQPPHFEIPLGHSDEDDDGSIYGEGQSGAVDPRTQQRQASPRYGGGYPPEDGGDDARFDRHGRPRQQAAGVRPDDVGSDGHTLSEMEQMINQTIQQFNIEEMRVPTSKDMAFGMAQGDGPFDISDIWAVDSQHSGSQRSTSQRQGPSEGGMSRDDSHEVNSYSGAYPQQSSLSRESSLTSGRGPQPAQLSARDARQMESRPGSAQPRPASPHHRQLQQRLQQQDRRPLGPRLGLRIHSAGGAPEMPRRQTQQQQPSLLAQHGAPQSRLARQPQDRGPNADPAILRRAVTPTGRLGVHHHKAAQPRVSPRWNQPGRSAAAAGASPGRSPGRAAEPLDDGCTFQPRINPRSREIAQRLLPVDRERRLEQLSRPRNDRIEERYQQLRQAREEEELRDCTFQPQTGRPPSVPRVRGDQPVHDRLYNVKPAWMLRREEILREREQSVLASCTFQPQCGSRQTRDDDARRSMSAARRRPASAAAAGYGGGGGGSTPYVPIHQRVADLLRSRNEKLAKAQIRMELGCGSVTFQPEINRRSVFLAAERQRQQPAEVAALPASERLYRLAQERQEGRRAAGDEPGSAMRDVSASRDQRRSFQSGQQQQLWGVPSINPRSRALAESSDLPQDFLARQAYLAALGHEKRALYRSLLEESTCTFQPQLLSRAGSLNSSCGFGNTPRGGGGGGGGGGSRLSGSGGSSGDWLSKLAYEDVQRSAALRDALEQHHYGQYTFTPAINERSRQIGRRHSLTDLHRDEERQAKLERLAAAAEEQRAANCTFKPAINPRSASLGRQRRGSLVLASTEGHEQANKLRSSILTEARALKEYEELKECTFAPAINRNVPKPTGPVAVPGLGRYMELRDLARRKREAEETRKEEVWNARPKSPGPPAGLTVPRPFSFEARVLPWQVPRAQMAQQQQDQEQSQRQAIAALKQQRQQQRKDAEERRSAHLAKIVQEAQAQVAAQIVQHQERVAAAGAMPSPRALAEPMQTLHQRQAQPAGSSGADGRRRSVSFQSPSSSEVYGRGSPRGVAEMPAEMGARQPQLAQPLDEHRPYGGNFYMDANGNEFQFPDGVIEMEFSVRFP